MKCSPNDRRTRHGATTLLGQKENAPAAGFHRHEAACPTTSGGHRRDSWTAVARTSPPSGLEKSAEDEQCRKRTRGRQGDTDKGEGERGGVTPLKKGDMFCAVA